MRAHNFDVAEANLFLWQLFLNVIVVIIGHVDVVKLAVVNWHSLALLSLPDVLFSVSKKKNAARLAKDPSSYAC